MSWFFAMRWLCRVLCRVLLRIKVWGRENVPTEGPVLLISNHQSFLDPVLCGIPLKRPTFFLARDSLFTSRSFGWLISRLNTIPVRRGQADLKAVKVVIEKLKMGHCVCLFPEGTRTRDGRISEFKPGLGLLCRRGWAAIVPVVVDGAFECWPRHKRIFRAGSKIAVSYGKCISPQELKDMDDRVLAERLTATLRQMQRNVRAKQAKEPYDY